MSETISRRRLLQAAGGITFLALAPNGRGAFAVDTTALRGRKIAPGGVFPLFTATPYLQPGPNGAKVAEGAETMAILWQTDQKPATFRVTVKGGKGAEKTITPSRADRIGGDLTEGGMRFNYTALLSDLDPATKYAYRVTMNGATLAEGYFTTRKRPGQKTRFVAFGDNSFGDISDRMIAHQAYAAKPDFVMNTGDNVYSGGTDNEYQRFWFPIYNADISHPRVGAPLLRSVPYYSVIANHDVHGKDKANNNAPAADFGLEPDSGGYFTCLHLPQNGLDAAHKTPLIGPDEHIASFRAAAGARYPRQANYSFYYGDAFFLCLDSNVYIDPTDPALQKWVEDSLKEADARWKFVIYHHPAFNAGYDHYAQQHMRVLSPIFERTGVDVVLHGHEHNYQRTRPFKFAPKDTRAASDRTIKSRVVPGTFTIDTAFDGAKMTKPNGVIYITTGAGGNGLYDIEDNDRPERWKHKEDDYADYVARFVSDRHSLTVIDMDANALEIKQIDQWGAEVDKFRITKA